MVGRDITPTEIGKHSKLIKVAQEDMAVMDVLVCGRCLTVFHFVEEFEQHKQKPCFKENNNVRECNDTKPKIWAFLLWKATQLNNNRDNSTTATPNSWALYQTWVKMDESLRETWIVAGKTIQSFAKVSQGSLQEMPVKITKTVVNNSVADGVSPGRKPLAQTKPQVTNVKPPIKLPVNNKTSSETENQTSVNKSPLNNSAMQKMVKKPITTTTQIQNKSTVNTSNAAATNKLLTRRAKRSVPNSDEYIEENVEKIVAKRFNPRRRMHEYLVKWETQSLQNTWEPASHLENVPHLLETFEKQLARQKETRAALQAKQQQQQQQGTGTKAIELGKKDGTSPKIIVNTSTTSPEGISKSQMASPSADRPQRTSKTKAMDQVKQWVTDASNSAMNSPNSDTGPGNEPDKDWSTGSVTVKRKLDDSDFNDSNNSDLHTAATTSTMEDLEEDLIPSHTLKRMKYGNAVSVEVKTKQDNLKHVKVNGTSGGRIDPNASSAEVIITQDSNASGVVRKPGFNGTTSRKKSEAQIRVLSKGESAVTSSGIVRINGGNETTTTIGATISGTSALNNQTQTKSQMLNRTQQVRSGSTVLTGPRSTTTATNQVRQVVQQQIVRTPGGTTIQRKTISTAGNASTPTVQRTNSGIQSRTMAQASPSSGRMIIPRQSQSATTGSGSTIRQKAVTPEQKILQLSKSGDLKVTKKVMTREDVLAQRAAQQHQQRQQQARQQSQVHIQKVQQLSGPAQRQSTTTVTRKSVPVTVQSSVATVQEEEHQAQLCPVTGNIIGPGGTISNPDEQLELHSQLAEQQQQQQQQQQQLSLQQQEHQQQLQDSIEGNILLTQDQMLTNEDGTPLLVTGEDGTVYQVAGKNAEGQTILVTQGPDGEQQFAYVAAAEGEAENQVLTLDNAVAEAVAQLPADQQAEALAAAAAGETGVGQYLVKTTQEDGTTQMVTMTAEELAQHQELIAAQQQQQSSGVQATNQLCIQTGDGSDGQEANIPAEVVQAELPSPGGTRRVVLMLQDGTFMMTEMHDDEFKALNIAA